MVILNEFCSGKNAKDMFQAKRSPTFMFFRGFKEDVFFFFFWETSKNVIV